MIELLTCYSSYWWHQFNKIIGIHKVKFYFQNKDLNECMKTLKLWNQQKRSVQNIDIYVIELNISCTYVLRVCIVLKKYLPQEFSSYFKFLVCNSYFILRIWIAVFLLYYSIHKYFTDLCWRKYTGTKMVSTNL